MKPFFAFIYSYRLLFVITFCCILTAWNCRKSPVGVEMSYQRNFVIQGGLTPLASHNFEFRDILPDTAAFFNSVGINSTQIVAIEPRSMRLQLIFNTGINLNFIERAEVQISTLEEPTLGSKIIFFRDDVPINTSDRLDLIANNVDIKNFLYKRRYQIKLTLFLRQITPQSLDVQLNWAFFARTN